MKKNSLIILADGFEEIEAITSIDVLRRAGVKVIVAGLNSLVVSGAHGIKLRADIKLRDAKRIPDCLILPGGLPGAVNLSSSKRVNNLIKKCYSMKKVVAAICASPSFVLSGTGILMNKKATCYPGCQSRFRRGTKFIKKPVVIDRNIITSRGPGTAVYFALAIAEKLVGKNISQDVKKRMLVK